MELYLKLSEPIAESPIDFLERIRGGLTLSDRTVEIALTSDWEVLVFSLPDEYEYTPTVVAYMKYLSLALNAELVGDIFTSDDVLMGIMREKTEAKQREDAINVVIHEHEKSMDAAHAEVHDSLLNSLNIYAEFGVSIYNKYSSILEEEIVSDWQAFVAKYNLEASCIPTSIELYSNVRYSLSRIVFSTLGRSITAREQKRSLMASAAKIDTANRCFTNRINIAFKENTADDDNAYYEEDNVMFETSGNVTITVSEEDNKTLLKPMQECFETILAQAAKLLELKKSRPSIEEVRRNVQTALTRKYLEGRGAGNLIEMASDSLKHFLDSTAEDETVKS